MKNLSSLTTFFITFLIVVYLGIFSGLKINGFISNKRLVAVSSASASSTAPQASPQVSVLAAVTVQTAPVASAQDQPAASVVDTSTPVPAPVSDTQPPQPPPQPPPPPPPPPPPAPSEPPPSDRCIVTISGGQYDVTDYRNIHSGGDVFACGSDMTAAFLSQHPASFLQKMSKYRV